jgi:hypothetical protein
MVLSTMAWLGRQQSLNTTEGVHNKKKLLPQVKTTLDGVSTKNVVNKQKKPIAKTTDSLPAG